MRRIWPVGRDCVQAICESAGNARPAGHGKATSIRGAVCVRRPGRLRTVSMPLALRTKIAAAPLTQAATIAWTNWSSVTAGNPGSGTGTIALSLSISVSYSGQTNGRLVNYPSCAPPQNFNAVQLMGGVTTTNTITFSEAVTDPIMAIWSLGAPGNSASFNFTASEPFTIQAGGVRQSTAAAASRNRAITSWVRKAME
jgi:hypothetical protein